MFVNFEYIEWKNIAATGNQPIRVDLSGTGTTVFYGPSGAGKSTILDALCFCLFGKAFRDINKGDLVNTVNGKGALTTTEFTISGDKFKIIRGISPNTFEIYRNGELIDQHGDSRNYQDFLESKILGFNQKTFTQVVILSIMNYTPFMKLSSSQRKEFVEELLDIRVFSKMNELLKQDITSNKRKIEDLEREISSIDSIIESAKGFIENLRSLKLEASQDSLDIIKSHQEELLLLEERIDKFSKIVDQGIDSSELGDLRKKLRKLEDTSLEIRSKMKGSKEELSFFEHNDTCPTCKRDLDSEYKTPIIESVSEKIRKMETIKERLSTDIETTREILSSLEERLQKFDEVVRSHSNLVQQRNRVQQTLNQLSEKKQDSLGSFDEKIHEQQTLLSERQERKISLIDSLNSDKKRSDILSTSQKLLKDSGVKAKVVSYYIPVLNKEINYYLELLGLPVDFTLDENFNEKILSRYRDSFTYDHFSAGEKSRINIALTFAWRKVAESKNTLNTNLLFVDELLDSSLGDKEVEIMVDILKDMGYRQRIFVTTHRHVEMMMDKFDSSINFKKNGNFTEIELG